MANTKFGYIQIACTLYDHVGSCNARASRLTDMDMDMDMDTCDCALCTMYCALGCLACLLVQVVHRASVAGAAFSVVARRLGFKTDRVWRFSLALLLPRARRAWIFPILAVTFRCRFPLPRSE